MSKATLDKCHAQLGISLSSASKKLARIMLFDLLQKSGALVCFRCALPIETMKDFTLDHKEHWMDVDPKLFWDPANIAYSHFGCNARARRNVDLLSDERKKNRERFAAWKARPGNRERFNARRREVYHLRRDAAIASTALSFNGRKPGSHPGNAGS